MQDCLDSLICLLVASCRRRERTACFMLGDVRSGYIVAPAKPDVRARLRRSASPAI